MEQVRNILELRMRLLTDDERWEARAEGREEGRAEGRAEGEKRREDNILRTLIVNALKLKDKSSRKAILEQVMQIGNMTQKSCLAFIEDVANTNGLNVPKNIFDSGR